jgi:hypothetical protein
MVSDEKKQDIDNDSEIEILSRFYNLLVTSTIRLRLILQSV